MKNNRQRVEKGVAFLLAKKAGSDRNDAPVDVERESSNPIGAGDRRDRGGWGPWNPTSAELTRDKRLLYTDTPKLNPS